MTDHASVVLSPVERRLLELVAEGRALLPAGAELALDLPALTSTVTELRRRFGVRSTSAAVRAAAAAGLLRPQVPSARQGERNLG